MKPPRLTKSVPRGQQSVPARAWEALRLQQSEGLTFDEIAERMDVPYSTVNAWFSAIRESRRDHAF